MTSERDVGPAGSNSHSKVRTELARRVMSAVVLATIVVVTLLIGGVPFALIWLVAGIVGFGEWLAMSRCAPSRNLHLAGGATLAALVCAQQLQAQGAVFTAALAAGILALSLFAEDGASRRLAIIGLLAAAIIVLVPASLRDDSGIGIVGPAWMFAVVWSTDIAAYFTGRSLGGPKLMPRVSPNKTWSGAIGGLLAGLLAGTGVVAFAQSRGVSSLIDLPLLYAALASAVASILSQGGDLLESALKRRYGVKDSGHSIPGHGGIMDRLDGFFAVALLVGLALAVRFLLTL